MTCLICEECEGQEFTQENPIYHASGGLIGNAPYYTQIFRCKKCGAKKEIPSHASGITLPAEMMGVPVDLGDLLTKLNQDKLDYIEIDIKLGSIYIKFKE